MDYFKFILITTVLLCGGFVFAEDSEPDSFLVRGKFSCLLDFDERPSCYEYSSEVDEAIYNMKHNANNVCHPKLAVQKSEAKVLKRFEKFGELFITVGARFTCIKSSSRNGSYPVCEVESPYCELNCCKWSN